MKQENRFQKRLIHCLFVLKILELWKKLYKNCIFSVSYDEIWFGFIIFNLKLGIIISQNCLIWGTILKWIWQIFHKRNQNYNLVIIFIANCSSCQFFNWWSFVSYWTAFDIISFCYFLLRNTVVTLLPNLVFRLDFKRWRLQPGSEPSINDKNVSLTDILKFCPGFI